MSKSQRGQRASDARKCNSPQSTAIVNDLYELLPKPICWMYDLEWIYRILIPSTERKGHTSSSGFGQETSGGVVEDRTELPSLPDLLDELDSDVDLNCLEQLTQSLLQDIARDLEATSQKTNNQENEGESVSGEMVGQPSAQLESSGTGNKVLDKYDESEFNITEYLLLNHNNALLHHNYAAKPPTNRKTRAKTMTAKKYKAIRPKSDILNTEYVIENTITSPIVQISSDSETLDGNNSVTLCINDSNVSESIIEVTTTESEVSERINHTISEDISEDFDLLSVPSQSYGNRSPMSSCGSDHGYESLDSPCSVQGAWDHSITELFPSLL